MWHSCGRCILDVCARQAPGILALRTGGGGRLALSLRDIGRLRGMLRHPFDAGDLSLRDIVADRFDACAMPRTRIRHRTKVNLLEAVATHPDQWFRIRACLRFGSERGGMVPDDVTR